MKKIYSTKSFYNLPCAHAQFFDTKEDGSPGDCASLHGYDRSVHFTFAGEPDDQGWIYPFGELKSVKNFLEYYFDHTILLPANDPRIKNISNQMLQPGGLLGTLRLLPYGVSMEMSSLFVWEHVNPYIWDTSNKRVYVSRVEIREHEKNSAFIEVNEQEAINQAYDYSIKHKEFLPKKEFWEYCSPQKTLS